MSEHRYEHDPAAGETHGRGDGDPHERLNTPVSEVEEQAEWDRIGQRGPEVDVAGMGRPQTSDTRGTDGDPELSRDQDERETRNPGQSTPFGETDAEGEAMRRVEEETGVPLTDDD
jgi:hypothetical protein